MTIPSATAAAVVLRIVFLLIGFLSIVTAGFPLLSSSPRFKSNTLLSSPSSPSSSSSSIMTSPAISATHHIHHVGGGLTPMAASASPMSHMPSTTSSGTSTFISNNNSNNAFRRRQQQQQQTPASISSTLFQRGGGLGGKLPNVRTSTTSSTSLYTAAGSDDSNVNKKCPFTKTMAVFGSFWGSLGVVYILAKAIKRVLPVAMEPFKTEFFTPFHWSMYALSCLFFAYAEGYKGFHLKFSPLVVKRSFTLLIGTPQGNNPLNYLLAPLYSMGLIHATKKRMIVSWSVSLGVATIVAIVKRLPPIPRIILDAGVVVGLTLGSASILYYFIKSFITGTAPDVDACLPVPASKTKK